MADISLLRRHLAGFIKKGTKSKNLVLIRKAESSGNLSGTIHGWMDFKLTDYG